MSKEINLYDTVKMTKEGIFKNKFGVVVEIETEENETFYYIEFIDGNCLPYQFKDFIKIWISKK